MNPDLHRFRDLSRIIRNESFHDNVAIASNKLNNLRLQLLHIALTAFAFWWLALMFLHFTTPT